MGKKKSLRVRAAKEWEKKGLQTYKPGQKKASIQKNGTKFHVLLYISGYIYGCLNIYTRVARNITGG